MSLIGKRLNEIKEFEGKGMYVKFLKSEHLDFLLDGNLYMNNIGSFINMEKEQLKKGQGDKFESSLIFRFYKLLLISGDDVLMEASSGYVQQFYEEFKKIPVFCFTMFESKDFKVTDETNKTITIKLDISIDDQNEFVKDFGDTAVIFPSNLKEILETNISKKAKVNKISYLNYNGYSEDRQKEFDSDPSKALFWKDEFFQYQREIRIAVFNNPVEESLTINIGNLRDTEGINNVYKTEQLFKDFTCILNK